MLKKLAYSLIRKSLFITLAVIFSTTVYSSESSNGLEKISLNPLLTELGQRYNALSAEQSFSEQDYYDLASFILASDNLTFDFAIETEQPAAQFGAHVLSPKGEQLYFAVNTGSEPTAVHFTDEYLLTVPAFGVAVGLKSFGENFAASTLGASFEIYGSDSYVAIPVEHIDASDSEADLTFHMDSLNTVAIVDYFIEISNVYTLSGNSGETSIVLDGVKPEDSAENSDLCSYSSNSEVSLQTLSESTAANHVDGNVDLICTGIKDITIIDVGDPAISITGVVADEMGDQVTVSTTEIHLEHQTSGGELQANVSTSVEDLLTGQSSSVDSFNLNGTGSSNIDVVSFKLATIDLSQLLSDFKSARETLASGEGLSESDYKKLGALIGFNAEADVVFANTSELMTPYAGVRLSNVDGQMLYLAMNTTASELMVEFPDGYSLLLSPESVAVSGKTFNDVSINVSIMNVIFGLQGEAFSIVAPVAGINADPKNWDRVINTMGDGRIVVGSTGIELINVNSIDASFVDQGVVLDVFLESDGNDKYPKTIVGSQQQDEINIHGSSEFKTYDMTCYDAQSDTDSTSGNITLGSLTVTDSDLTENRCKFEFESYESNDKLVSFVFHKGLSDSSSENASALGDTLFLVDFPPESINIRGDYQNIFELKLSSDEMPQALDGDLDLKKSGGGGCSSASFCLLLLGAFASLRRSKKPFISMG